MPPGYKKDGTKLIPPSRKGCVPWNKGKIGLPPSWNKGKKMSEEARRKMSLAKIGKTPKFIPDTTGMTWKHSEESKKNMSLGKIGKRLSVKHREKISIALTGKLPKNINTNGTYGNVKRGYFDINGKNLFFRSKWEANYALYLDFLVKQKEIKSWEYEVDVFIFHKIQFGTRSYRPDFKIINNKSEIEYNEVKGYMDAKSKTKLKRMAKYYPEIKLILIDSPVYGDIKNKLGRLLKFY